MDADEIYPLTRAAVRELLAARREVEAEPSDLGLRRVPRWPFPGSVEIWAPTPEGRERHSIATLHNLSELGVGVRSDVALELGKTYAIAVHQPEASFHGRATVRHCTPRRTGYQIGMEFELS